MSLSPTTSQIKIKELILLQIQSIYLSKYSSRNTIKATYAPCMYPPQDMLLQRLQTKNIFAFTHRSNRVMQAFSFLLLRTVYGDSLNENLLNLIKIHLYSDELDLKIIENSPLQDLSSEQMKKFVVEFIVQLYFADYQTVFEKRLAKHPVILIIMSVFLRCVLIKLGLQEAKHYEQSLPTETVVELLGDFFDLNYRKTNEIYQFIENNLFLYQIDTSSILLGTFGSPIQPRQSQKTLNPELKRGERSYQLTDSLPAKIQVDNFLRESNMTSQGMPTPFFNNPHEDISSDSFGCCCQALPFNPGKARQKFQQSKTSQQKQYIQGEQILSIKNYNITTPSVASIQEKLQFLTSPTHSDRSGPFGRNTTEYRFDFAANLNQQYFIKDNPDVLSQLSYQSEPIQLQDLCPCKEAVLQKLAIYSNVYELTIQSRCLPEKEGAASRVIPSFILEGKFRKLSEISFKKNATQRTLGLSDECYRTQRVLSQFKTQETASPSPSSSIYQQKRFIPQADQRQHHASRPLTQYISLSTQGFPKYVLPRPKVKINYLNS